MDALRFDASRVGGFLGAGRLASAWARCSKRAGWWSAVGNTPSFGAPICPSMGGRAPFCLARTAPGSPPSWRRFLACIRSKKGPFLRNPRWSVMRREGAHGVHIFPSASCCRAMAACATRAYGTICGCVRRPQAWTCPTRHWPNWPSAWTCVTVWTIACFRSPRVSAGKSACSAPCFQDWSMDARAFLSSTSPWRPSTNVAASPPSPWWLRSWPEERRCSSARITLNASRSPTRPTC